MNIVSLNLSRVDASATGRNAFGESGLSFLAEPFLKIGMMSILQKEGSKSSLLIILLTITVKNVGFASNADFR